jgi:hypothetical protein
MLLGANGQLVQIILALRLAGRGASGLNGREQELDQQADDSDDNQRLNESDGRAPLNWQVHVTLQTSINSVSSSLPYAFEAFAMLFGLKLLLP